MSLYATLKAAIVSTKYERFTIILTPELAVALKDPETVNRNNRQLKKGNLDMIRAALVNDEWVEDTGRTIVIATHRGGVPISDRMIDGQHLCTGVVETGVSVQVDILWGADERSWDRIDRGARRIVADMLRELGVRDAGAVAAMLGRLFHWENGARTDFRSMRPTPEESKLLYAQYTREITAGVSVGNRAQKSMRLTKSIAACAYVVIATKNPTKVDSWFEGLITGVGLLEGDSRLALRTYVLQNHTPDEVFEAVIRAWNLKTRTLCKAMGECPDVKAEPESEVEEAAEEVGYHRARAAESVSARP